MQTNQDASLWPATPLHTLAERLRLLSADTERAGLHADALILTALADSMITLRRDKAH